MVSKARNSNPDLRVHTFKLLPHLFIFFTLDNRSSKAELIFEKTPSAF